MIIGSGFAEVIFEVQDKCVGGEQEREESGEREEHVVFKQKWNPLLIIADKVSYTMPYYRMTKWVEKEREETLLFFKQARIQMGRFG